MSVAPVHHGYGTPSRRTLPMMLLLNHLDFFCQMKLLVIFSRKRWYKWGKKIKRNQVWEINYSWVWSWSLSWWWWWAWSCVWWSCEAIACESLQSPTVRALRDCFITAHVNDVELKLQNYPSINMLKMYSEVGCHVQSAISLSFCSVLLLHQKSVGWCILEAWNHYKN